MFKIDRTTTCVITQHYVPNQPVYVKMSALLGGFGGSVNNSGLPWKTLIEYVKSTQGSTVVFKDDFSQASTIEPGLPARRDRSLKLYFIQRVFLKSRLHRLVAVLIVSVIVTVAGLALWRIGV